MPDNRPLILVVRHAHAEPEVFYDDGEIDVWFADSSFANNYYGDLQAQLDDFGDMATEADGRDEPEIARRLRSLIATLSPK